MVQHTVNRQSVYLPIWEKLLFAFGGYRVNNSPSLIKRSYGCVVWISYLNNIDSYDFISPFSP